MSSANPDRTPILNLPSPTPADPPDVPGDIKALADAIDPLGTRVATLETGVVYVRKFFNGNITTNGFGEFGIQTGFQPVAVSVIGTQADYPNAFVLISMGTDQVKVKAVALDGTPRGNTQIAVAVMVFGHGPGPTQTGATGGITP